MAYYFSEDVYKRQACASMIGTNPITMQKHRNRETTLRTNAFFISLPPTIQEFFRF